MNLFSMISICFSGVGGVGKSSTLASLALDWANNAEDLKHIDFVFLIQLRYVSDDRPLSDIIVQQHGLDKVVKGSEIESLLEGETDGNAQVILMFDGYDEYTKGTNTDIDNLFGEVVPGLLLILSSRPGSFLIPVAQQMDGELVIAGFSKKNIMKCIELYLGPELLKDFLEKARISGITELLSIPIIVLMCCFLYKENQSLPHSRTELFEKVIYKTIERTLIKSQNKLSSDRIDTLLTMLGKLSWEALQRSSQQLLIKKVKYTGYCFKDTC